MRIRADKVPALDEPPPATVDPGPVAEAVVRELALLVWVNLLVELVGVDVVELETRVLLLVEHDPDAEDPPLARNPQFDLAQLLLTLITTGLAGTIRLVSATVRPETPAVRFTTPTVPRALLRVLASASVASKPTQPTVAANKPMPIRRIT
ncbi:MAG: hypothetical protein RMK81_14170, partial [Geminicoccaceae bacterium]|nr:hypothetical protein [Geminicoccaceae bacterium]